MTWIDVVIRTLLTIAVGVLIGTERARHGRAAGMRTHILVCMGSALTSMTGVFINQTLGSGDTSRISAQVISGIGFLCAGMIILKKGNFITGLTTAAGMWITASIGIAIGYGFYVGGVLVAVLFYISLIFFAKLERNKRNAETFYIEIGDLTKVNFVLDNMGELIKVKYATSIVEAKSGNVNNIGIYLVLSQECKVDVNDFLKIDSVLYAIEE